MSADPTGIKDLNNLYVYARSSPINHVDPAGTDSRPNKDLQAWKKEMLAELASLKSDVNKLMTSYDMEYLRADALTKQIDAQEALITAQKAGERAMQSKKSARTWVRIAAAPKLVLSAAGAVVSCAAAETGIGAVGCVYAFDAANSASRELVTGEPTPTITHEAIARPLEATGLVSKKTADTVGNFGEVLISAGTSSYNVSKSIAKQNLISVGSADASVASSSTASAPASNLPHSLGGAVKKSAPISSLEARVAERVAAAKAKYPHATGYAMDVSREAFKQHFKALEDFVFQLKGGDQLRQFRDSIEVWRNAGRSVSMAAYNYENQVVETAMEFAGRHGMQGLGKVAPSLDAVRFYLGRWPD